MIAEIIYRNLNIGGEFVYEENVFNYETLEQMRLQTPDFDDDYQLYYPVEPKETQTSR